MLESFSQARKSKRSVNYCLSLCLFVSLSLFLSVSVFLSLCLSLCACLCLYLCVCLCARAHVSLPPFFFLFASCRSTPKKYGFTHTHTHGLVYVHTLTYMHTCMHAYIHTHTYANIHIFRSKDMHSYWLIRYISWIAITPEAQNKVHISSCFFPGPCLCLCLLVSLLHQDVIFIWSPPPLFPL